MHIPTLGEILGDEITHYSIISNLIATPYDMVIEFEEAGIDYFSVDDFILFSQLFLGIIKLDDDRILKLEQKKILLDDIINSKKKVNKNKIDKLQKEIAKLERPITNSIFEDLDIRGFQLFSYKDSEEPVLYNQEYDIIIDKKVQQEISNAIEKIYSLKKSTKKIANAWALEAIVDRARQKRNMAKRKGNKPYLENLLVRMVNKEGFKYNFETSMDLNIYAFNKCVESIQIIQNYELTMQGVYSGNINYKDLKEESLNWLS